MMCVKTVVPRYHTKINEYFNKHLGKMNSIKPVINFLNLRMTPAYGRVNIIKHDAYSRVLFRPAR